MTQETFSPSGQNGFGGYNNRAPAPDADEFLFGGASRKGRSMTFPQMNLWRVGTVTEKPTTEQQMDPETRQPKFWPNSNDPVYQIVVPVQVDLARFPDARNPELGADDDGKRFFYLSGSRASESKSSLAAIRDAVAAAGAPGIQVGAEIGLCWIGNGPKSPNAPAVAQAPKQYQGHFQAPADAFLMGGSETVAPPAPPAAPAPVAPPTAPPVSAGPVAYGGPTQPYTPPTSVPPTPGPGEQGGPPMAGPVAAALVAAAHPAAPIGGPSTNGNVTAALSREDEIVGLFTGKAPDAQIRHFIDSGLPVDKIVEMFGGMFGVTG